MKSGLVFGSMVLALIISIFLAPITHATSAPSRQLAITPLRTEYTIPAGTTQKGTITLKNTGTEALNVTLDAEAFKVINENYDYAFFPNAPSGDWVSFSADQFELQANTSRNIEYSLNVPLSAEPGGKYLSIFAASTPTDQTKTIIPVERVGSLLYLTIPGHNSHMGKLLSLHTPFVILGDSKWDATIQNNGNDHFRGTYTATLSTITKYKLSSSTDNPLILPQTVRLISDTISAPQWIGIYRVDYDFNLGDSPDAIETRWLVNLPPLQLGALAAILFAITLINIGLAKKIKRHHKKPKKD